MVVSSSSMDGINSLVKNFCLSKNSLNVCHLNARSLNNKTHEINDIFINTNIHAILVSETWLHPGISSQLVQLDNYKLFRNDRTDRIGGGVAIYLRPELQSRVVCCSKKSSIEFLAVEISSPTERCIVCVVYSPPNSFSVDNLCEFESSLLNLSRTYSKILVGGDFNVNLHNDCRRRDDFLHFFQRFNLHVVNSHSTYCNTANPSLLDLFLVSESSSSINFNQLSPPSFLDHDLIFINYSLNFSLKSEFKKITIKNFCY